MEVNLAFPVAELIKAGKPQFGVVDPVYKEFR